MDQLDKSMAQTEKLLAQRDKLRAALKDAVHALDGVACGDFVPTGSTVRSALQTGVAALNDKT